MGTNVLSERRLLLIGSRLITINRLQCANGIISIGQIRKVSVRERRITSHQLIVIHISSRFRFPWLRGFGDLTSQNPLCCLSKVLKIDRLNCRHSRNSRNSLYWCFANYLIVLFFIHMSRLLVTG